MGLFFCKCLSDFLSSPRWGLSLGFLTFSVFSSFSPAQGAETVVLKYSILRESISVPELRTLVDTGEVSPSLKAYLALAQKNPQELRSLLSQPVEVNGVFLSQVLNSFAGEVLLDKISHVVHTPSKSASRQALRGALVTSALPDNNIRLIEVLENYPTSEVHLEGDLLAQGYRQLDTVISKLPRLPF